MAKGEGNPYRDPKTGQYISKGGHSAPTKKKEKSWQDKDAEEKERQIARVQKERDERNSFWKDGDEAIIGDKKYVWKDGNFRPQKERAEKNGKNIYEHLDKSTKEKVDFIAKEESVSSNTAYDMYKNMSSSEKRTYSKLLNEQKRSEKGLAKYEDDEHHPTPMGDLKKGDFFKLSNKPNGKVYVRDFYDKSEKAYWCYEYYDVNSGRYMKKGKTVYTGFTF